MDQPHSSTVRRLKHGTFTCTLSTPLSLIVERHEGEFVARDARGGLEAHGADEHSARQAFAEAFHAAVAQGDPRVLRYAPMIHDARQLTDHDLLIRARFARTALDAFLGKDPQVEGWYHRAVTITSQRDGSRSVSVDVEVNLKTDATSPSEGWQDTVSEIEDHHCVDVNFIYVDANAG